MLIQFVLIAILAVALVMTWKRVLQNVISRREGLLWSAVWIVAGVVIFDPRIATAVANLFGVGRGSDFVLYGSVVALFILVFRIFVTLENLERKLTEIVRKEALRNVPREDR